MVRTAPMNRQQAEKFHRAIFGDAPMYKMSRDERRIFDKLVLDVGCSWFQSVDDFCGWYDSVVEIDGSTIWRISLRDAVKRIDKEATYEEFSKLTDDEKRKWNNLVFGKLGIVHNE